MPHIPLVAAAGSLTFLRKGHTSPGGIFSRIVVNSEKLSFPSSSHRKEGLLKYIGNIKEASRVERGLGSNPSTGTLSPSPPPGTGFTVRPALGLVGPLSLRLPASPLPEGRGIFSFKRAEVPEVSPLGSF